MLPSATREPAKTIKKATTHAQTITFAARLGGLMFPCSSGFKSTKLKTTNRGRMSEIPITKTDQWRALRPVPKASIIIIVTEGLCSLQTTIPRSLKARAKRVSVYNQTSLQHNYRRGCHAACELD